MRTLRATGWSLVILSALIGGCTQAEAPMGERDQKNRQMEVEGGMGALSESADMAAPPAPPAAQSAPGDDQTRSRAASNQAPERSKEAAKTKPTTTENNPTAGMYIVRTAAVTLKVEKVQPAIAKLTALVREQGGFISDSNLTISEGDVPSAQLTARVPSKNFETLVGALGDVGTVRARSVNGEDVTLEYVDTSSRIRNLQKEEATLLKLLERSGKLSDVLMVERELSRVRGEIEQAQGRIRQLANLVDLSTVTVSLQEQVKEAVTSPWSFGPAFENAVKDAQAWLAATATWLIQGSVWLGAALLIGIPALLLYLFVGSILRTLLVDRRKLVNATLFNRLWTALGLVILCFAFPPLIGFLFALGLIVCLIWLGMGLIGRFTRRSSDRD